MRGDVRAGPKRAIALFAAAAMVLGACGGGGDSSDDSPSGSLGETTLPPSTAAPAATTSTTAAAASPTTTDDVQREWTNAAVSVWQQFLADQGAAIDVDGIFGPQTEAATLDFQRRSGIPETGVADRLTLDTAGAAVREAVFAEMTVITTTTTSERLPSPDDPVITISCPPTETETEAQYRATFGHTASYSAFGSITIDYGDGKSFSSRSESSGITGAFWHVYDTPGTYTVTVTLTDADGVSDSASCTHTWAPA